jgi:hypothetical protein
LTAPERGARFPILLSFRWQFLSHIEHNQADTRKIGFAFSILLLSASGKKLALVFHFLCFVGRLADWIHTMNLYLMDSRSGLEFSVSLVTQDFEINI